LFVALEEVYAVLRSERPLEPTQQLLSRFAQDAVEDAASTLGINVAAKRLQEAAAALGTSSASIAVHKPQTSAPSRDIEIEALRQLIAAAPG
jgi:hypothetical protein